MSCSVELSMKKSFITSGPVFLPASFHNISQLLKNLRVFEVILFIQELRQFWKGYIVFGSKQEVTKIVSLCEKGG